MLRDRNSISFVFLIATLLCLVCSLVVAAAAIGLRDMQQKNVAEFRKSNILQVAGFDDVKVREAGGIDAVFNKYVTTLIVDLETGELAEAKVAELLKIPVAEVAEKFDQLKISKMVADPSLAKVFTDKKENIASIGKARENFGNVYLWKNESGEVERYIFPVRGLGLWSTLLGFIALEKDLQTVSGLTFYEHKETPGLGGEVENPTWKKLWVGKKVFNEQGEVALQVVKGSAEGEFGVDGLSGATITSNGVTNLVHYWLGPSAFGPFIDKQKNKPSGTK